MKDNFVKIEKRNNWGVSQGEFIAAECDAIIDYPFMKSAIDDENIFIASFTLYDENGEEGDTYTFERWSGGE